MQTDWQSVLRAGTHTCCRQASTGSPIRAPLANRAMASVVTKRQGRVDRRRPGRYRENNVRGGHQSGPKTDFGREQPPCQVIGRQGGADRQDRRGQACGELALPRSLKLPIISQNISGGLS